MLNFSVLGLLSANICKNLHKQYFSVFFSCFYAFSRIKLFCRQAVLSEEHLIEQEQREENELLSKITKKDSVREKKSRGLLKKIKKHLGISPSVFLCSICSLFVSPADRGPACQRRPQGCIRKSDLFYFASLPDSWSFNCCRASMSPRVVFSIFWF